MFIALDKLANQRVRQAIVVVPERSIGASFHDEPLSQFGFWADWHVEPKWNLCNAPGTDGGKVNSVGSLLESGDKVLVCTHATFRFAVDRFGVEAFDDGRAYLIHRIFEPARLDIEIKNRFGNPVIPREWFLVPLFVIDDVVEKIKDGTITGYVYDPSSPRLVGRGALPPLLVRPQR